MRGGIGMNEVHTLIGSYDLSMKFSKYILMNSPGFIPGGVFFGAATILQHT